MGRTRRKEIDSMVLRRSKSRVWYGARNNVPLTLLCLLLDRGEKTTRQSHIRTCRVRQIFS